MTEIAQHKHTDGPAEGGSKCVAAASKVAGEGAPSVVTRGVAHTLFKTRVDVHVGDCVVIWVRLVTWRTSDGNQVGFSMIVDIRTGGGLDAAELQRQAGQHRRLTEIAQDDRNSPTS